MRVVALVSGGKDSCYSIYKCRSHGHEVIALAHIAPPEAVDEPDSLMYQSVGSSAVQYVAEALQLPLYVTRTSARAVLTTMTYTPTAEDEVEDLVRVLQLVKKHHTDVEAVCAGALWSDYQRLRVESAASRVGLLSIAYLWRREQRELLDEMIKIGMDAILVKVAGIGLKSEHLGKSLLEMRPTLIKLADMYGSHVCGEGGEFESFVLWMPGFRQQIVLDQVEVVMHSDDPVAAVSYLKIVSCHMEDLTSQQMAIPDRCDPVLPSPFLLAAASSGNEKQEKGKASGQFVQAACAGSVIDESTVGDCGDFMQICIRSSLEGKRGVTSSLNQLKTILEESGQSLASVVYVTLFLQCLSGDEYKSANNGYVEIFGAPECIPPPSRACVGISEINPAMVIEVLVRKNRDRADPSSATLHVQSLSEWAPPCIGPYAQFVEEDGIIHVCGVLPLYAPLASILDNMSARQQVQACIYNLGLTLEASRAKVTSLGLFIVYVTSPYIVDEVLSEMRESLLHDRCISVVVPVSELPKGGLVEIRAVGSITDEELSCVPSSQIGSLSGSISEVTSESVTCGKLAFVAITAPETALITSAHEQGGIVQSIVASASSRSLQVSTPPIGLQVYAQANVFKSLTSDLATQFPKCAINVMESDWMPNHARLICLATFSL